VLSPRPIQQIAPADLYWLAGLLEGEGTFIPGPPSAPEALACLAEGESVRQVPAA
jgi:hypothetical protein